MLKFLKDLFDIDDNYGLKQQAWKAQKANRPVSVESLLVEAALIGLINDYNFIEPRISEILFQKARNGIFENESFVIHRNVIGKELGRGGVYSHEKYILFHTTSIRHGDQIWEYDHIQKLRQNIEKNKLKLEIQCASVNTDRVCLSPIKERNKYWSSNGVTRFEKQTRHPAGPITNYPSSILLRLHRA